MVSGIARTELLRCPDCYRDGFRCSCRTWFVATRLDAPYSPGRWPRSASWPTTHETGGEGRLSTFFFARKRRRVASRSRGVTADVAHTGVNACREQITKGFDTGTTPQVNRPLAVPLVSRFRAAFIYRPFIRFSNNLRQVTERTDTCNAKGKAYNKTPSHTPRVEYRDSSFGTRANVAHLAKALFVT